MTDYVWGSSETQFFFSLNPDTILDAIDELGYKTTGRCLPLNSMENRVYEIEIDIPEHQTKSASDNFIVAKFYRPGRWSREQILDEHLFLKDLTEAELSVIAPIEIDNETVFQLKGHDIFYSIFPKKGGRNPEEMDEEQLQIMGRTLARLHNVGAQRTAGHRITIDPQSYGVQNLKFLQSTIFVPNDVKDNYFQTIETIIDESTPLFKDLNIHRIHGDFHKGNIILRDDTPYIIDFDDMLMGPAVQDVWPIVPGDDEQSLIDRTILLEAYDEMRSFPHEQMKLIPSLRALRLIHFSAWIAKRWDDPAFKNTFPYFESPDYWYTQLSDLRNLQFKINEAKNPYPYY